MKRDTRVINDRDVLRQFVADVEARLLSYNGRCSCSCRAHQEGSCIRSFDTQKAYTIALVAREETRSAISSSSILFRVERWKRKDYKEQELRFQFSNIVAPLQLFSFFSSSRVDGGNQHGFVLQVIKYLWSERANALP